MGRWGNVRLLASGAICSAVILVALFAPWLAPSDPLVMNTGMRLLPAAPTHPLGTDEFGRDILSRLLWGSRASLLVAVGSVTVAMAIGTTLGLSASFFGGGMEQVAMRAVDVVVSFPPIFLAMGIVALVGSSVATLVVVIGILYNPQFARLTFALGKRIMSEPFVEAARAIGASNGRIMVQHLLPNIVPSLVIQASLSAAAAILLESGLSFLGLGVQAPTPSWGLMISEARGYMSQNPGYVAWPSAVIAGTILAINTFGDALRDTLDPQLRGR